MNRYSSKILEKCARADLDRIALEKPFRLNVDKKKGH